MSIHAAAQSGFDADAARYARGRPDYPAEVTDWLRDRLELEPGKTVVDLGAGTGKFTARLAAIGASVVAVEPVAEMRARLAEALPAVTSCSGTAEAIPLPDASVDALTCAQSFHWFANPQALREIARVLKPGGRLGLIWNVRDETVPWVARLSRLMAPYEEGTPRFHHGTWRRLFPDPRFTAMEETVLSHAHSGPFAQVVRDRILSVSFIASLPEAERSAFAARLEALAEAEPALADRARVSFPYRTLAIALTRR